MHGIHFLYMLVLIHTRDACSNFLPFNREFAKRKIKGIEMERCDCDVFGFDKSNP
jgi:hypothetical protein